MADASIRSLTLLPIVSLWRREVVRFVRQRSRIIGALATPLVFWLLIGSGLGRSFRLTGADSEINFLEYFFPGTVVMIVLFTAIFSTISVIEDRKEGFLQAVLAAPVGRSAIVMGKVLGSATLAVGQALVFLLLAPLAGVPLSLASFAATFAVLLIVAVGLSALGLLIAWSMESTQGYHAIMNLFLMPMWFLSGALFPASGATSWLKVVMMINPLTYGVAAVRRTMYLGTDSVTAGLPSLTLSIGVSLGFAALLVTLSALRVKGRG